MLKFLFVFLVCTFTVKQYCQEFSNCSIGITRKIFLYQVSIFLSQITFYFFDVYSSMNNIFNEFFINPISFTIFVIVGVLKVNCVHKQIFFLMEKHSLPCIFVYILHLYRFFVWLLSFIELINTVLASKCCHFKYRITICYTRF
ncbi:LOW QUALITY PROTEIN: Protein of unknown function [Gryllus bimaculatus]|nr:LOW QUALITY PROTEIN: Protein of unknown function [Gryllus bimaculatus]